MDWETLTRQAEKTLSAARAAGATVATAESCTGGLVAAALTAVPGSSEVFHSGFVTYANQAKMDMLGVAVETLQKHGAVSPQTAEAMAAGAREAAEVTVAVSLTGIAGPGGASAEKPVGLVWIGVSGPNGTHGEKHLFGGNREEVRFQAALAALHLLENAF